MIYYEEDIYDGFQWYYLNDALTVFTFHEEASVCEWVGEDGDVLSVPWTKFKTAGHLNNGEAAPHDETTPLFGEIRHNFI